MYVVKVLGTAIVDKEYLSNTFNDGKEIEVLAGDINDTSHPYGVILTDYLADSFNYVNMLNLSYEEMIGQVISSNFRKYYVNAIIKTNYKERNKELFDKFEQIKKQANFIDEYKKLLNEDIFINFFSSIINLENLSFYTTNSNFFNDIVNDYQATNNITLENLYIAPSDDNDFKPIKTEHGDNLVVNPNLNNYQIAIDGYLVKQLSAIFNTNDLIGKKFKIIKYPGNDNNEPILSSVDVEIAMVGNSSSISKELCKKLKEIKYMESGCVIPLKQEGINEVITKVIANNYHIHDINSLVYTLVHKTLVLYTSTFQLVEYILIGIILVYFSLVSVKGIKDFKYQIGVFKSLGMNDSTIFYIFLGKNVIFSVISCVLIFLLSFPFLHLANILLIASYVSYVGNGLKYMSIFYFHPDIFIFNFIFVLLVILISSFIPLYLLKKVTPAKIVNTRED